MTKTRLLRGLAVFFLLLVAVYTAFILYTGAEANAAAFLAFDWHLFPVILALVLVNFVLREVKWDFFRRSAGIDVPRKGSFLIFFSGYSMCISPGRVGELIKPALYKYYYNAPWKKSVPLVFCERLTDLLGMVVICLGTMFFYMNGVKAAHVTGDDAAAVVWTVPRILSIFAASIVLLALLIGLVRWRAFVHVVIDRAEAMTGLRGPFRKIRHLYDETFPLLTFRNLSLMTLLAAFSWSFECLAMYAICYGFGISDLDPRAIAGEAGGVSFLHCMFIFCISSIIGGLFFFAPGGLGPVELVMQQMLILLGAGAGIAVMTMFLTRFSTLIFGAALGFLFLGLTARHHRDAGLLDHMTAAIEEGQGATTMKV